MEKKSINISLGPVVAVLRRFHLTLFIIFVVAGLAAAVMILNQMLIDTSNPASYTSTVSSAGFDQTTIDRIAQLKPSSDPNATNVTLPTSRINPFSE